MHCSTVAEFGMLIVFEMAPEMKGCAAAIMHGLKRVEAGAQGSHKIQRGYLPVPTYSAHWIRDPGFSRAVADFVRRERRAIEGEMDELAEILSPFKREADGP